MIFPTLDLSQGKHSPINVSQQKLTPTFVYFQKQKLGSWKPATCTSKLAAPWRSLASSTKDHTTWAPCSGTKGPTSCSRCSPTSTTPTPPAAWRSRWGPKVPDCDSTHVSFQNQWTDGLTSRLHITSAHLSDSGNYSCVPTIAAPTSVNVHVINGKRTSKAFKVCVRAFTNGTAGLTLYSSILHQSTLLGIYFKCFTLFNGGLTDGLRRK